MNALLNPSQLRDARDWLAENTWADMAPEDFGTLTDAQITAGIAKFYVGGVEAFITSEPATQSEPASAIVDRLTPEEIMHAGAPEREATRGYLALRQATLDHLSATPDEQDAISAEIIHRYVHKVREGRKGQP